MVSCSGLLSQIGYQFAYVCYGISNKQEIQHKKWKSTKLQFLFSGTLLEEVGSLLLLETLSLLRNNNPELSRQIHVVVTGKGSCTPEFRSFAANAPDLLTFHGSLSRKEYLDIIRESHIGMSLRLSKFEMGSTTFPSKVIEYAEHGLVVLTTRSSDVPTLFGETAAYLSEETPAGLAYLITGLINSREHLIELANSGHSRIDEICSPLKVGIEMKKMLLAKKSIED
jgi:glycosyltransferase involved in cell wall biosynthesis